MSSAVSPANRIGIDYQAVPARRINVPIVDIHAHVRNVESARLFLEVALRYGVRKVVTMTGIDQVDPLMAEFPDFLEFNAVPNWRAFGVTPEFGQSWMADLASFRQRGARLCKFWMAPPARERNGLTLEHEFLRPVIDHALDLGYEFMVHIGDPSVWWRPGAKYADNAKVGTKRDQYSQLESFLMRVSPRRVIGAHMGGTVEDLPFLQSLLDRFPNYFIDTSATKWIVREVAWQPEEVGAFVTKNAERVLFGSDLVTETKYDFDHYASRYWSHQMMWESAYRGESPIEDPDAPNPPLLSGVNLGEDVLRKIYVENAARFGYVAT